MSSRRRALVVLVAVLILGFLLGTVSFRFWERGFRGDRGRPDSARMDVGTERLGERLHLNAEQQAQLDSILADLRAQIRATREKMGKEFDAIRARTNERIAAILTPEQRERFEQLLKQGESRGRPGGRRGGDRSDDLPRRESDSPHAGEPRGPGD